LKSSLNSEDFLVGRSVRLTLAGIILGAVFTSPRFIAGFLTGVGFMSSGIVCFALSG
jgi:hypothetical protein